MDWAFSLPDMTFLQLSHHGLPIADPLLSPGRHGCSLVHGVGGLTDEDMEKTFPGVPSLPTA